jgi:thymidylate synthase (FAD)
LDENQKILWDSACRNAEISYFDLINYGATPQMARTVLPNSVKTEIVMTCNLREWRHVLKLRTSQAAHPQMRSLMVSLLELFKRELPEIFGDL